MRDVASGQCEDGEHVVLDNNPHRSTSYVADENFDKLCDVSLVSGGYL